MSTIGGAFTETQLLQQRVMAANIMFDDRIKQQFKPDYDIINAIQRVQTATVLTDLARRKDVDVEVIWENFCDITTDECGSDCSIGGNESSTNAETYSLSFCKEVGFTMDEVSFIDNEFEMNIAKALLKSDVALTNAFAAYAVSVIESAKGTNELTTGKGTVSGTETYIDPAYWNSALFAYFQRVAALNKFTSPILLSGNNLYEAYYLANAQAGNANGKGDAYLFGTMPIYFDLFNIDTVNTPDLKTYMLSTGSLAMANKFYNPSVPEKTWEFTRYTMPSQFLPGMTYDVFYNNECSTSNRLLKHNWTVRLKADIFTNPAGCTLTNTGVLSFTCGTNDLQ